MSKLAVVVPTCRDEQIGKFLAAWDEQFRRHEATVLVVRDDTPSGDIVIPGRGVVGDEESVLGASKGIVARKSPACRCLGFAYIVQSLPDVEYVVTLDDDVEPDGDTIGDHLAALERRVPVSWMSSTVDGSPYMRGFPYGIRQEAPVWVSHGVWKNIPDLDAPTQLVLGSTPPVEFYRGPVPKGVYFPVCGMNLAFRREAMPLMLWCPCKWLPGAERFDDIWMGFHLVRGLAAAGAALVSGMASCVHTRLSNTFANLRQEAHGIGVNEDLWRGDSVASQEKDTQEFLRSYEACRRQWAEVVCEGS